jgi:hypothetical protein
MQPTDNPNDRKAKERERVLTRCVESDRSICVTTL